MLKAVINKLNKKQDLTTVEAAEVIDIISSKDVPDSQIAELLISLSSKGATVEEMTGFALEMRKKAVKINTDGPGVITDSCGTGGDGTNTFNISTAAAIVAASCGVNIAKHSNYKITGNCGSSNVLEALGIPLLKGPYEIEQSLKKHSIGFIHAPYFHQSTAKLHKVRRELKVRTIFNFLGPLTNPALPTGQVIGVSAPDMLPKITHVLRNLGCNRAMVVCGIDPLIDEISICGPTKIYRLEKGEIDNFEIKPADFGMETAPLDEISGGDPDFNAGIIRDIFSGKRKGPDLDILLLNTAAVLWAGNMAKTLQEGVELALKSIESGKAAEKLLILSKPPVESD